LSGPEADLSPEQGSAVATAGPIRCALEVGELA